MAQDDQRAAREGSPTQCLLLTLDRTARFDVMLTNLFTAVVHLSIVNGCQWVVHSHAL